MCLQWGWPDIARRDCSQVPTVVQDAISMFHGIFFFVSYSLYTVLGNCLPWGQDGVEGKVVSIIALCWVTQPVTAGLPACHAVLCCSCDLALVPSSVLSSEIPFSVVYIRAYMLVLSNNWILEEFPRKVEVIMPVRWMRRSKYST